MQWTQRPFCAYGLVGVFCRKAGPLFVNANECIEFRIPSLDLLEMRFDQLAHGDASVANHRSHLPCGESCQFRHGRDANKNLRQCLCEYLFDCDAILVYNSVADDAITNAERDVGLTSCSHKISGSPADIGAKLEIRYDLCFLTSRSIERPDMSVRCNLYI